MQANGVASSGVQAPTVERLERDERAMTDEQRMSAVMADAPELAALLSELQGSLAEVRSHVGPVLKEVRAPCALWCSCDALKANCSQCACYRKVQYQCMQPVSAWSEAYCEHADTVYHGRQCANCCTSSTSCSCNCHLLCSCHSHLLAVPQV